MKQTNFHLGFAYFKSRVGQPFGDPLEFVCHVIYQYGQMYIPFQDVIIIRKSVNFSGSANCDTNIAYKIGPRMDPWTIPTLLQ